MTRNSSERGYTLTELLTVVAIAGIVTLVSIPAFTQLIPQYRIKSSAQQLAGAVRMARQKAIANRAPWRVSVDLANDRFTLQRMEQIPTAATPVDDPASWLPVSRVGAPLLSTDPIQWVLVAPADLTDAGAPNTFRDVDGDGIKEIVFTHTGEVARYPTKGMTNPVVFTDAGGNIALPEVALVTESTLVAFNRYSVQLFPVGQVQVQATKQ